MSAKNGMSNSYHNTNRDGSYNNSEMNAVRRLSEQEGLDDNLEDIHAVLSKRGTIRTSLHASTSLHNGIPTPDRGFSPVRPTRRSYEQERERQNSSGRPSEDDSNGRSSNDERRRRRRSQRRHNARTDGSDDGGRPNRSASAIEKLLEYNEAGNYSMPSNESSSEKKSKNKNKSSMNPLLLGLSKSRDSGKGGLGKKSGHKRRSKSREKRHSSTGRASTRGGKQRNRSTSAVRSSSKHIKKEVEESPRARQRVRRRRSSSSTKIFQSSNGNRFTRGTKSLRATRSFMTHDDLRKEGGIPRDTFERLWGKKITSEDLNQTNTSHLTNDSSETDTNKDYGGSQRDLSGGGKSVFGTPGKVKKTKLEKIHELQGQCDSFKIELDAMAEERYRCERELNDSREQAASLKRLVEVHEGQSAKLKLKLTEAQDELESTRMEQRTERTELSDAAKDLARVNIEYAKSVDMTRTVKEELNGIKGVLAEREEEQFVLEKKLKTSNENMRQLEADVLYADDHIGKLEADIKKLESEVALYTEAADRDSLRDGDSDGMNLREAKNEADKLKFEEREKEIDEKNRKAEEKNRILEEEMKDFERQKSRHLEEQQLKEREFEDKLVREEEEKGREEEKAKRSDEDQLKKDEETNDLLNALEDENTALNGRLKSEQLESTIKLRNQESVIFDLQTEVARLAKEQEKRDSAPDSSPTLLIEIDTLKTEATRRHSDFEVVRMARIELEDELEGLQCVNIENAKRLSNLESEIAEQKKEFDNQRRKTLEWQKKTGEWSEKAVMWKQRSEYWEKKAKESNNDNASSASDDAAQVEPQALFLAAAVEKKAANFSAANANGSIRWGRRIFGMSSVDSEDEAQALISKLEGETSLKETEIKALKSEMVKMQTNYKEQAYSKTQECEQLQKEKEAIELKNTNLLKELELARKLNRTISESAI